MSIRVVMDVKDFVASDVAGAGEVVLRVGVVRLRRSGKAGEGRGGVMLFRMTSGRRATMGLTRGVSDASLRFLRRQRGGWMLEEVWYLVSMQHEMVNSR